jgi:hypothetical protein
MATFKCLKSKETINQNSGADLGATTSTTYTLPNTPIIAGTLTGDDLRWLSRHPDLQCEHRGYVHVPRYRHAVAEGDCGHDQPGYGRLDVHVGFGTWRESCPGELHRTSDLQGSHQKALLCGLQ